AMFGETDQLKLSQSQLRGVRVKGISIIFQDPMTSLNPFLRIGDQMIEPLLLHFGMKRSEAWHKATVIMEEVGITRAAQRMKAYPFEFSGGMRQRVMIAMALITEPEIIIADEPTTALDVTVQAEILDLIRDLRTRFSTSVILITHDLGVVAGTCDHVVVMRDGEVVERAAVGALFDQPQHDYTRRLLAAVPKLDAGG
ncbi:MAG: ABC transporter ATP-binding protein, partial [Salinisphaeraceae bacterium]